jgi:DNA polymerase I-like protein with 3'-5' exonuclease and polymerase domains
MKRILLDIETNTKHDHIWVVVTKDIDTGEIKLWKQAKPLVEYLKDTTLIVAHNAIHFDVSVLNRLWATKIRLNQIFDTLIVSRLLDPSLENGHSLEAWGERLGLQKIDYRGVWLWMTNRSEKDTPKLLEFDEPHEALMDHYCIRDVEVLEVLYHHLVKELKDKEFSEQSVELEHKVAAIISKQEQNGFKLDQVYATNLLVDIQGKLDGIYEQMQQRWPPVTLERISEKTGKRLKDTIVTFNPGSRQQIAEKLMELGWKPKKHTDKGSIIVDEAVLSELKYPEAKLILDYLLLQKRISQIKSWFDCVGSDGRVHGRVITNGAVTGRATHSTPNMGQIPNTSSLYGKECRECWTVEEGNVLIGVDLSGIELRCFAHYLNDDEYTKAIIEGKQEDGTDVHTRNQKAFGVATRNDAKTVLYATLYGASPGKVGSIIGGTQTQGKKIIDSFERNVPAYAKLKRKVAKQAAKGWLPGLDGRRLNVRSEHSALNTLLQSAGAIIAKQWLVNFEKELREKKVPYKLVAWVHDEVQIEARPEYAEFIKQVVIEAAQKAGTDLQFRCPVDAEGSIGANWYETH